MAVGVGHCCNSGPGGQEQPIHPRVQICWGMKVSVPEAARQLQGFQPTGDQGNRNRAGGVWGMGRGRVGDGDSTKKVLLSSYGDSSPSTYKVRKEGRVKNAVGVSVRVRPGLKGGPERMIRHPNLHGVVREPVLNHCGKRNPRLVDGAAIGGGPLGGVAVQIRAQDETTGARELRKEGMKDFNGEGGGKVHAMESNVQRRIRQGHRQVACHQ